MYLDHFGLVSDPFALSPDLKLLYLSQSHEETIAHLVYGLEQGEEIILLTGDIGMGKTLALQSLEDRISSSFRSVVISSTKLDFHNLLKLILMGLDVPPAPNADLADLHDSFRKVLKTELAEGRRLLLIVDESQNLDLDALESLRLLLSLAPSGANNLNIVLAGQPGLNEKVNLPELAQLRQRIRVHYHMEPLTRLETEAYINYRVLKCGQEKFLFHDKAIDIIYSLSKGVPRLVNHLANQGLLAAFVSEARVVKRKHMVDAEIPGAAEKDRAAVGKKEPQPETTEEKPPVRKPFKVLKDQPESEFTHPHKPSAVPKEDFPGPVRGKSKVAWLAPIAIIALVAIVMFWSQISGFLVSRDEVDQSPVYSTEAITQLDVPVVVKNESSPEIIEQAQVQADLGQNRFAIHIASFRRQDHAGELAKRLKNYGFPAFVGQTDVNGVSWHRVYVGKFPNKAKAVETEKELIASAMVRYSSIVEF